VASASRSPCVSEERLLAFHAGSLRQDEEEEIREHLAVCTSCEEVGRDARLFLEAMGERPRPAARMPWRLPLAAAASVTLALGAAWLAGSLRPRGEARPPASAPPPTGAARIADGWGDVRVAKAPYSPSGALDEELVFRGESDGEERADGFTRAMDAYTRDDFSAAGRDLAAHLARHPHDRRGWFYLGVSQLLLGRTNEALSPLRTAAEGEGAAALEARYYLALASLKAGDTATAAHLLESVERSSPERRDEARALLRRLRGAADQ
jgi:hypothetical protein